MADELDDVRRCQAEAEARADAAVLAADAAKEQAKAEAAEWKAAGEAKDAR
jgi:hypothetical protein